MAKIDVCALLLGVFSSQRVWCLVGVEDLLAEEGVLFAAVPVGCVYLR